MNRRGRFFRVGGAALVLFAATVVRAATIYVDDDCIAPGTGTQADPFCSIQRGIDESVNGILLGTAGISVTDRLDNGQLAVFGSVKPGASIVIADMVSHLPPVKVSWNSATSRRSTAM